MATRRARTSYISGHCAANSKGGHDRCHVVCEGLTCRCECHFDLLAATGGSVQPEVDAGELEDDSETNEGSSEELVDVG